MVQHIALAGFVFASAAVASARAGGSAPTFTLTFTNKCSVDIDLYTRLASVYTDEHEVLAPGASVDKPIGKGFEGHFRNGSNDAATLIEFATKGDLDLAWFDLGIIPPHLLSGHEFCASLADCKLHSKSGIGFNTPVQVTPLSNTNGENCRELTCLADGCEDAYNFPQDDTKTHSCPFGTNFVVTFCPSGATTEQELTSGSTSTTQETIASKPSPLSADSPTQEAESNDNAGNVPVQDDSVKGESETGVATDGTPAPEVVEQNGAPAPAPEVVQSETEAHVPAVTPEVASTSNHCE
ncbi:unnamed protein product [Hyaloperonospora brassicae]|uniref:Thaumatin-like protein n=1 Tax=Hyaloperonospora brassicae TaxID=162125 RepID=A0AAV0TPE4_HYABA|nr:unnamed protein product [Hyaloperonospora brassicae]